VEAGRFVLESFLRAVGPEGHIRDLGETTFVDAYGLVGLVVALTADVESGREIDLRLPASDQTCEHLARMGFASVIENLGLEHNLPATDPLDAPDVVTPIRIIDSDQQLEQVSNLLYAQLDGKVSAQALVALSEGLWEMAANALEHSGSRAVVMAQVYGARGTAPYHQNTVQIAIGDAGRGIRESFLTSELYDPANDADALRLATKYLVSSVDDPGRGQGLHTTLEETTGIDGTFSLRSGDARLLATRRGTDVAEVAHLSGTVVGLVLPLWPGG
jgi:hypothetical protein